MRRVGPMHTASWGDSRGFSGKYLPKDALSMLRSIEYRGEQDYPADLDL
ncbi:MAG: hypothetical protein QME77_09270 [bacterium]|nr:hypothetical protein [bacterium]